MRKFTFGLPGKWQGLMRKAGLLLIPLVSFISSQTNAQTNIANYAFSSSMGNTYTPIIGGTTVHSGTYDDAVSAAITMGGTFPFGGANITSCYISTNGFITFGAAPTSSTYTPLSTVSSIAGAVSPYGQDAGGSTVAGAVPLISYLNTGTDFIVQYADHANYYNRSTEKLNFQIRLTYATGEINIIYGTCTNPSTVSTSGTAPQVGIRGNSSTWADNVNNLLVGNVPAATTCDWSNAVSGNANSSAMLYSGTTNGNVKIPAGLQYSWTPPGIAPVRTFAATSAITSSGATITWTAPTGATQYNVRYRIPGTCTWTNFSGNPVAAATASLSGLAPVTSYQVQVQASNGTTNSIWSHIPTSAAGAGLNGYTATGTFTTLNNACSGTPSAGTISGPSLACSGQPFNLVSTGTTVASGLKFSWQKSSDGGGTWVNLNNTATVTTPYAVAQTVATSYRLVDTCTNSGLSSISNVIDIAMNTALNCYCVYAASSSSSYFDAFATTGGSTNISNTASGFATGGYQNATGMIVTQDQGGTINFTTTLVGTTVGVAIWVDWNDDGIFDNTTERVYNTAAYVSTASGSFIVPASASAGNHRMRIAMDYNATSPSACGPSSGRGEAEDYTLKVTLAAPCSGTPAGVAITPAAVTVCGTGGATFSATTTSPGSGFTYLWESKPGGTNSWAPIAGATSSTYTATGVSGNTDYRCTISCSGSPSVSNTAAITVSSIPVNDDCANALTVTVQNYAASCSGTASINTTCATFSSNTSNSWFSSQDDDVWYKFQATSASGSINLSNVIFTSGVPVSIGVSFYNDSSDCSKVNSGHELSTTLVPSTITITSGSGLGSYSGLVPGNWYTIRFLTSGTTSRAAFDFCVMEPAPATYISSTTTQPVVTSVVAGTVGQQIIRVEVVVNGTINPLSVTQLVFNTNGTTNGADIDSARVYYTGTSTTFATTNKFGTTAQAPNGSFSFSGAQTLTGGTANTTNYFWLVYDVNCSATVGDVLDAECTSVDINGPQTPTVTSPAGSRAITAASYTASTTQPATTAVLQGSLNAQVLRVTVTACVNAPVTDLNFATTGTTNASADIVRARVFYTTSTTFSTASQFGPDYSNPNGAFTISGSQPLPTGTGYFWLVYDVAGTAPITDSLDASCLSAVVNGNMATPATVNPTGKRPIFAPIPNDDAPGSILLTVGAGCSGPIYSNVGATKSSNEVYPSCAGTAQAPVWFKFVAPASGAVRISNDLGTIGTFTDSKIGLFSAGNVNDYST
ncbi:MAG: GEVED domain-containing protein, partial [Chitinophagaceae bacterium]